MWQAVGTIAGRQHGVVARGQLRTVGLSEEGIAQALASGRIYPLFWSTYTVGHQSVDLYGRLLGATLACGERAVVSHGSAAWLLGLWSAKPGEIEVIAPVEAGRKITGIRRRFVPPPLPEHVREQHGIPCTSPSRTIIDIAGICGPRALADAVEEAAVQGVLDIAAIDGMLSEHRRRGTRRLNLLLENWRRYTPRMRLRSRMEAKLLPMLTHYSLPIPETNVTMRIDGESFEVDFLWRRRRVVVETDGGRFHDNPLAQKRDAKRNQLLARAGYRMPRLGWDQLRDDPEATMAEIARFLRHPVSSVP
jgi:very-short-patch-repair endonuclease